DSDYWEYVRELKYIGSREVLAEMRRLSISTCFRERMLAANVLAELGIPTRTFPMESGEILARMLEVESDEKVLYSILCALGHQKTPTSVPIIARLLRSGLTVDLRFAAVLALS